MFPVRPIDSAGAVRGPGRSDPFLQGLDTDRARLTGPSVTRLEFVANSGNQTSELHGRLAGQALNEPCEVVPRSGFIQVVPQTSPWRLFPDVNWKTRRGSRHP